MCQAVKTNTKGTDPSQMIKLENKHSHGAKLLSLKVKRVEQTTNKAATMLLCILEYNRVFYIVSKLIL